MKKVKTQAESPKTLPRIKSATSPEGREAQLVSLAMDLAEERLRNGTATSQEVVHFLRLGSLRERYEREKLENENILLKAKTEALESQARIEELYSKAIEAMRRYNGTQGDRDDEEDDDRRYDY